MKKLSVNVDHVATLRQARLAPYPDPVTAASLAEIAGADGIIVHLREDRRHIQDRDVQLLAQTIKTKLILEMAVTESMLTLATQLLPHHVCFVPEKRKELTTEGGLDLGSQKTKLQEAIHRMREAKIPVSLFIDPEKENIYMARELGADIVELHTGSFCERLRHREGEAELQKLKGSAEEAIKLRLICHAGHGLDYHNLRPVAAIPEISEFNIGYSIIARAIYVGISQAVREMLVIIRDTP